MITRCPACDQLTMQDNRCFNPGCAEDAPIQPPVTFSWVNTTGGYVLAVCSRCGALVADWGRSGWPNQRRHSRWHQQS